MVKVRGHRIELGGDRGRLARARRSREAAVVPHGEGASCRLVAFVVAREQRPSLLALKQHCAERLPRYMIVDRVRYVDSLPRNANGKVDRKKLETQLASPEAT